MSQFRQIRILECTGCGGRILLPSQNPEGKSFAQHSWPTDTETLTLVCHSCGRLSDYSLEQIRFVDVRSDDQVLLTRTFRRVEFACDQENCGRRIVVHLETEKDATPEAIKNRVLTTSPNAGHGKEHILSANCVLLCNSTYFY